MVISTNVFINCLVELFQTGECFTVVHFRFAVSEEVFHHRIVG